MEFSGWIIANLVTIVIFFITVGYYKGKVDNITKDNEAFEDEGLNAFDYGVLCYDEWEEQEELKDEEGNVTQEYREAGNRYGIRYEELLCFIMSAL